MDAHSGNQSVIDASWPGEALRSSGIDVACSESAARVADSDRKIPDTGPQVSPLPHSEVSGMDPITGIELERYPTSAAGVLAAAPSVQLCTRAIRSFRERHYPAQRE